MKILLLFCSLAFGATNPKFLYFHINPPAEGISINEIKEFYPVVSHYVHDDPRILKLDTGIMIAPEEMAGVLDDIKQTLDEVKPIVIKVAPLDPILILTAAHEKKAWTISTWLEGRKFTYQQRSRLRELALQFKDMSPGDMLKWLEAYKHDSP